MKTTIKATLLALTILAAAACAGDGKRLPLEGTEWKLVQLDGRTDTLFSAEKEAFTLTFNSADHRVAGQGACNRYFGDYTLDAHKLDIRTRGTSMMACPGLEAEDRFLKVLDAADGYRIKGSKLELLEKDKVTALFTGTAAPVQKKK